MLFALGLGLGYAGPVYASILLLTNTPYNTLAAASIVIAAAAFGIILMAAGYDEPSTDL